MTLLTPEDHALDGDVERADDSSSNTAGDHVECEQDEKKEKSEAVDDDASAASPKTPNPIAVALITQRTSTATLLFNLAGSLFFFAGSIGFIWSTWTSDWLRPFQYGCTIWILGCILFLPLLALLQMRCRIVFVCVLLLVPHPALCVWLFDVISDGMRTRRFWCGRICG